MELEEKKRRQFDFIRDHFTEPALTELALFNRNSIGLINVIRLEMALHEKIEKGEFPTGLPEQPLSETKQFLYMDALAKIMMLIEGSIALSDAISDPAKGYPNLADAMTSYRDSSILAFVEKFRAKQVDLQRLAGLPVVNKLLITESEKDIVRKAFEETENAFEQFLNVVISFYECNSIPYNKFKHGLSLIPAMNVKNPQGQMVMSLLAALDNRKEKPSCVTIETPERLVAPPLGWFNILCFVPSPQIEIYESIITPLLSTISYITGNHQFYAVNCGEDYFPGELADGKFTPRLLLAPGSPYLQAGGNEQLEPVIRKIVRNMNMPTMTFNFNMTFSKEIVAKILEGFRNHGSALIWSTETEHGSARVDLS